MLYLVGMNMRARRSMNCIPRKVFTPMNINTPYSTGIGISLERKYDDLDGRNDDNDVDLLENRSKLCRESNKKENTDAGDSLERKRITQSDWGEIFFGKETNYKI